MQWMLLLEQWVSPIRMVNARRSTQSASPAEILNSNYYAYLIREMARTQWILALAKGIRERSTDFRFDTFGSHYLPMPSRYEQDAISAFLRDQDRHIHRFIRNRRRLIEVLNEQKQAIINRAVTRGLDPTVPLKTSGIDWLGDIPQHWQAIRLKICFKSADRYYSREKLYGPATGGKTIHKSRQCPD